MARNLKFRLGVAMIALSLTAFAVSGAFYLGKLYLGIVREGSMANSKKVFSRNTKSVSAQDTSKLLLLNPVPVYFLQVGVFSDLQGAKTAAKPLAELGYSPYITQSSPHKLWLGVYKNREDTEAEKRLLKDKGFGSFTGALVVNGSNLRYSRGNEAFIKEISPVLDTYTLWLKENLELFHADTVEKLDWNKMEKQETVIDSVYKRVTYNKKIRTNNGTVNLRLGNIEDNIGGYKQQLEAFNNDKSRGAYCLLQSQLLRVIDNYQLLLQEIDNISKT